MKQKTVITPKKLASYLVAISLLLLGGVLTVWWVLGGQLAHQQSVDTARYINYISPGLVGLATTTTVSETSVEENTVARELAEESITINNLSQPLIAWIEETGTTDSSDPGLVDALNTLLGLSLVDLTSLQILDGTLGIADLDSTVAGLLSLAGTVADNSITSLKIVDGAVQADDIANGAIGALQLAVDAVSSLAVADGSIGLDDLDAAVTAVLSLVGVIPDNSITSLKIVDGAIGSDDLDSALSDAVALIGTIADNSITSLKIVDGAIGLADLESGITTTLAAVGTVADGYITTLKIADGTIAAGDLSSGITDALALIGTVPDGYVTSLKILNGTIAGADIADGAIGMLQLGSGAVGSLQISDGSIDLDDLDAGIVSTLSLVGIVPDNSITSLKIVDGAIAADDIANGAINTLQLADGSVEANKLSTTSNTRTVSVQIGDLIALGTVDRPVFVAPSNGTITKVAFTSGVNISIGGNATVSLERKTATATTVASVDFGSVGLSAYQAYSPSLAGGTSFSTGDVYSFRRTTSGLGLSLTGFLVTIEYIPSE